jgi:hypothetical protein
VRGGRLPAGDRRGCARRIIARLIGRKRFKESGLAERHFFGSARWRPVGGVERRGRLRRGQVAFSIPEVELEWRRGEGPRGGAPTVPISSRRKGSGGDSLRGASGGSKGGGSGAEPLASVSRLRETPLASNPIPGVEGRGRGDLGGAGQERLAARAARGLGFGECAAARGGKVGRGVVGWEGVEVWACEAHGGRRAARAGKWTAGAGRVAKGATAELQGAAER